MEETERVTVSSVAAVASVTASVLTCRYAISCRNEATCVSLKRSGQEENSGKGIGSSQHSETRYQTHLTVYLPLVYVRGVNSGDDKHDVLGVCVHVSVCVCACLTQDVLPCLSLWSGEFRGWSPSYRKDSRMWKDMTLTHRR